MLRNTLSTGMETGFQFELLWNDVDVILIRIRASNGEFGGTADVYVPIGGLAEVAEKLEAFPRDPSDERVLQFGQFGPELAGGAVSLRFYCKGAAGRTFVEAKVESDYQPGPAEHAQFHAGIQASAVDDFVLALRRLESAKRGIAHLSAIAV